MNRTAAIALMSARLGFKTDASAALISRLTNTQNMLENGGIFILDPGGGTGFNTPLPWFLREEDTTLAVLNGVRTTALPTGFIAEVDGIPPHFFPPNLSRLRYLEKGPPTALGGVYFTPGAPRAYEVRASTIYWWPVPDANYTLTWSFMKGQPTLDTDIENEWLRLAPNLIIGHAGEEYALDLRDFEAAKHFAKMKYEGAKQLMVLNTRKAMQNRRTAIGRVK